MPQDHDELRSVPLGCKFNTADVRWGDDIAGHADDEQIAEPLIEDDLCRNARIRASEYDGKWILTRHELGASSVARRCISALDIRCEVTIPLSQAFECVKRGNHRRNVFFGPTRMSPPEGISFANALGLR
jgi:hypothetical protein